MPDATVPAAATGLPIPHPRLVELIQSKKLRRKVEIAVSRLIAVLDEIDADADAEPSLGAPERNGKEGWTYSVEACSQRHWAAGATDDREDTDEDGDDLDRGEHDPSVLEPSLSRLLRRPSSLHAPRS